jgi:hypothetical protein
MRFGYVPEGLLAQERTQKLVNKCRMPRGAFEKAITKVCDKDKLERHKINLSTVLIQNKAGHKLKVKHRDTVSPMIGIEAHLLGIILCRVALRQPVSCVEDIELANSLIDETHAQVDLVEWKKKHLKMGEIDATFGDIGTQYWQNFCRRNEDVITAKKAVHFASKRADWCHWDNLRDMYGGVYGRLHDMGIEEKLSEKVCRDEKNNIVETEAESYGQQTDYSLKHPEKLIMVEEVGENISQKGDGNTGGQNFMVANGMRVQVRNFLKDNHFTVLGFMAATGEAVMCAIIIAASKLKVIGVTGFNPLTKLQA